MRRYHADIIFLTLLVRAALAQVPAPAAPYTASTDSSKTFQIGNKSFAQVDGDRKKQQSSFIKGFDLRSFGFSSAPESRGFEFSRAYASAFLNPQGFECMGCIVGLPTRTRFTLPPFGARLTYSFWENRVQLFGLVGAMESWKPILVVDPVGYRAFTSTFDDSWLRQAQAGARLTVDRQRRIWIGGIATKSYNSQSKLERQWGSLSGQVGFTFGKK